MATLTFSNLVSETFAHIGIDSGNSANQTNVYRWLNYVQQDICARWPWSFMLGREAIVTVPDKTGTATVLTTSGNLTEITLSLTSADIGSYIQFSGANDWYLVTAVAAPFASFVPVYQGTSGTVTCIVRKFYYSLSSSCDRIMDVRNWDTPMKLVQVDARSIDSIRPNPQSTNSSYGYMTFGYDSSGNVQISPYPFPSDARLFEIRTHKRPVDMVVTSQEVVSIPNKYAHVIAWGAIAVGMAYLKKFEEATAWSLKFEGKIDDMKKNDRQSEDLQPMLQSIDSVSRTNWLQLPDNYPSVGGN